MANPHRGEVDLRADGQVHTLRLSLGSLAALEASLDGEGLIDFAERLERGGVRMRDVIAILAAGFQGSGRAVTEEEVAQMAVRGGAAEATRVALALFAAAFGAEVS